MKLQIMSDLHLEMHADGGAELIRDLDPTGVDVLVLAGDITMARHYENLESPFKALAQKYRHILYIPGNHEYYKSSPIAHEHSNRVPLADSRASSASSPAYTSTMPLK